MKKKQRKLLRIIAGEMVKKGAPATYTLNYYRKLGLPGQSFSHKQEIPINHYRRIKRLVTRNKMTIGQAIDHHASKYFDMKKLVNPAEK